MIKCERYTKPDKRYPIERTLEEQRKTIEKIKFNSYQSVEKMSQDIWEIGWDKQENEHDSSNTSDTSARSQTQEW